MICTGCTALFEKRLPAEKVEPALKWDLESYRDFVRQNMASINAMYLRKYIPCDFIVDTDYGSTRIQNLIDPKTAGAICDQLVLNPIDPKENLSRLYQYIATKYKYVIQADGWQTVSETVQARKGDCKNLSLLMLSLLISAGYEAYAAISNGHMWVSVYCDNQWRILELDQEPKRKKIYSIPGFYDYPLYRIYGDHSEKRKKITEK